MAKKKIVILINSMIGGGAERTVSYLLNFLGEEYETHLLLLENEIDYELPANQKVAVIDGNAWKNLDFFNIVKIPVIARNLAQYCRDNEISLVFSFLPRANFVASMAKKFGLQAKVLISERVYTPLYYTKNSLRGKIASFLISSLYPLADAVLPNSQQTAFALEKQYDVKSEYIVIKNMLDVKTIQKKRAEAVENIDFNKFTFVNLSAFRAQKNHRLLIEAFAELKTENAQLLLIGKGKFISEIKQLVSSLGLEEKVIFLEHQSNPFKYLSKADCFVMSSDFEGFPNVLLESLACELPIVSTDCRSGPRELLAPETDYQKQLTGAFEIAEYGILTAVKDKFALAGAMREMIKNRSLRDEYRSKSLERASEFDIDVVIEDYKQIIDRFLYLS